MLPFASEPPDILGVTQNPNGSTPCTSTCSADQNVLSPEAATELKKLDEIRGYQRMQLQAKVNTRGSGVREEPTGSACLLQVGRIHPQGPRARRTSLL